MTCNYQKEKNPHWGWTLLIVFLSSGIGTVCFNLIYMNWTNGDPIKYIDHGTSVLKNEDGEMKAYIIIVNNDSNNDSVINNIKINNKEFPEFYSSNTITDVKLRKHSVEHVTALICPAKKYCEIAVPYETDKITSISFFDGSNWINWK